jgi:hypothetical protein
MPHFGVAATSHPFPGPVILADVMDKKYTIKPAQPWLRRACRADLSAFPPQW